MSDISVDDSAFQNLLKAFADSEGVVEAQVVAEGKPADYAMIAEVGSRRGRRPWPNPRKKTTLGRGGRVFSKQAPEGYVARFNRQFQNFLVEGYRKFIGQKMPTREGLVQAANYAAEKARAVIRGAAPVDSGKLKNAIKVNPAK